MLLGVFIRILFGFRVSGDIVMRCGDEMLLVELRSREKRRRVLQP